MREINNILIYRVGNLGDIVCSMPAMVAVRKRYPRAWICLLTNKETRGNPDPEDILGGNDFLDEIIAYETDKLKDIRFLLSLLARIRSYRFDLLVYLSLFKGTRWRLIRDRHFFTLAGCRKVVGFKLPKPKGINEESGFHLPVYPNEVERLMKLLKPLGIHDMEINFRLPISPEDVDFVDAVWRSYSLKEHDLVIGICSGAKFPSKRWNIDRFAQVADNLVKQKNAKVVLVGGIEDIVDGEVIFKKGGSSVANLIGKTSYMQSAEIIRRCKLLVANDCGPVHLAAAVGTPVVGVYSSRDFSGAWHPWGENHTILRDDSVDCRFCMLTECETMECLHSITVEQVLSACQQYF